MLLSEEEESVFSQQPFNPTTASVTNMTLGPALH